MPADSWNETTYFASGSSPLGLIVTAPGAGRLGMMIPRWRSPLSRWKYIVGSSPVTSGRYTRTQRPTTPCFWR